MTSYYPQTLIEEQWLDIHEEERRAMDQPKFDLLEDQTRGLHAVLTRHGIASYSREYFGLVRDLVRWAASASRSTLTPSQNEQAWKDLQDSGGLPEAQEAAAAFEDDEPSTVPEGTGDTWGPPLRKPVLRKTEEPQSVDAVDPSAADPGKPTTRDKPSS